MMKKAEMGVGTLIVFIAMLLVAAVAAGVLIQTSGSLQEKSLSTGQQARTQISTNVRVIEVSASDGSAGNLSDFQQIVKLSPGSDPIKLQDVIFTFNTNDATSTLKYRGKGSVCSKNNNNGYNTWSEESFSELKLGIAELVLIPTSVIGPNIGLERDTIVDLDEDGLTDYVRTCQSAVGLCPENRKDEYLQFNLSNNGNPNLFYVRMINNNGTVANLSVNGGDISFHFSHLNITDDDGVNYGYINARREGLGAAPSPNVIRPSDINVWFEINKHELLEEDYNDDHELESFALNTTHAILFLSNTTNYSVDLGGDICNDVMSLSTSSTLSDSSGNTIATVSVNGDIDANCSLPSGAITITPYHDGEGYFSAIYENEGTNYVDGNLQRGDILRLCYEGPSIIDEDELVRLNFIPKIGVPTMTQFVTPDVISTERVFLYP